MKLFNVKITNGEDIIITDIYAKHYGQARTRATCYYSKLYRDKKISLNKSNVQSYLYYVKKFSGSNTFKVLINGQI